MPAAPGRQRPRPQGPVSLTKTLPLGDEPLDVYEGQVAIDITMEKTGDVPASARPAIVLTYQAYAEELCLLPEDVELPVAIRLGSVGLGTTRANKRYRPKVSRNPSS